MDQHYLDSFENYNCLYIISDMMQNIIEVAEQ